ncbi:hypothetical protein INS49_013371 [Diaporthe citri]|uniref:uncharacterized protein n=1 Tax=Diaporthe citri TaxID=83186 RepID=UPI001C8070CE|nr:uncharacterized protein INS49_013371 [Diaporthe citri]KAG6357494.1 hypothetical protein INS49_013371 [Diaporthe citri]
MLPTAVDLFMDATNSYFEKGSLLEAGLAETDQTKRQTRSPICTFSSTYNATWLLECGNGVNNGDLGLEEPAPFSYSTGVPQRSDTWPGVFRYAKYAANRHFLIIGILL